MGRLTYEAIVSRDYPLLMGLFVISSVLSILGLLMVDILYGVVDPRVRYDRQI
jgi:peptide/nickel transport system permease protein